MGIDRYSFCSCLAILTDGRFFTYQRPAFFSTRPAAAAFDFLRHFPVQFSPGMLLLALVVVQCSRTVSVHLAAPHLLRVFDDPRTSPFGSRWRSASQRYTRRYFDGVASPLRALEA